MTVKIGINGFGRIGRLVCRAACNYSAVDVVAINDLADAATMAHLLKYDSVHGIWDAELAVHDDRLEVEGKSIAIRSIREPEKIGWSDLGVDIVAECTGLFRDREGAKSLYPPRPAIQILQLSWGLTQTSTIRDAIISFQMRPAPLIAWPRWPKCFWKTSACNTD
jgi:glyceraldehyde-3-phosphate dehydrogenase/erythrose-4-phosphate dehydrogenase